MHPERIFVDIAAGQLHARRAGAGTATALLCLHHSPSSSRLLEPLVRHVGETRPTLAIDTPGYGESFQPGMPPPVEQYAAWIAEGIDRLALERVHLFGYHTGACIALELARQRPERVGDLVLCGIPLFDDARREAYRRSPWPQPVDAAGHVLQSDWALVEAAAMAGLSLEDRVIAFHEMRRSGQRASWGVEAVIPYELAAALAACRHEVLVIRCGDDLWEETARAAQLLPAARVLERPEWSHGLFQLASPFIAADVEAFLARSRT